MATPNTITTFLIDINPTMNEEKVVKEEVEDEENPGHYKTIERRCSTLEWCMEFVVRKVQQIILANRKTSKVCVLLFNSNSSRNRMLDQGSPGKFGGIYDVWEPSVPTIDLLDTLLKVRPAKPGQHVKEAGDAVDALIVALTTMLQKDYSGITERQKETWQRVVYIVTNARTTISRVSLDAVKAKIEQEKFTIRVMGVDFDNQDDEEGVQKAKPEIVRENEAFWHDFLTDFADAAVISASDAIELTRCPAAKEVKPVGSKTNLTFGDAKNASLLGSVPDNIISIPVVIYKATSQARPLSSTEMARIAKPKDPQQSSDKGKEKEEDEDARLDSAGPSARVLRKHYYFVADEVREHGTDKADPLPEGTEILKGYKLGADVVPVDQSEIPASDTRAGLEIIQFGHQHKFERQWQMGEVSWVMPDWKSPQGAEAEVTLSAITWGLHFRSKCALASYVKKKGDDASLVMLWPHIEQMGDTSLERLLMFKVAFSDDVRMYHFPPLHRKEDATGNWTTSHPDIPTNAQDQIMANYLSKMNLMINDEHGNETPWFRPEESWNPSLQNLNQAVAHKATYPSRPLLKPHEEIMKYTKRPEWLEARAQDALSKVVESFSIGYVPQKSSKRARQAAAEGQDGDADGPIEDLFPEGKKGKTGDDENEEMMHEDSTMETGPDFEAKFPADGPRLDDVDPLGDFERQFAVDEDDDSEAAATEDTVELLRKLQRSILHLTRAKQSDETVVSLLDRGRDEALGLGEALDWNKFIRAFKNEIVSTRADFWNDHIAGKTILGLICAEDDSSNKVKRISPQHMKEFVKSV